ncbi:MAG TPA: hypothetical protein VFQ38_06725 [Longimicrobiales bacterium]|nr:hypothetical protein [Longimicrobiales bacterium]
MANHEGRHPPASSPARIERKSHPFGRGLAIVLAAGLVGSAARGASGQAKEHGDHVLGRVDFPISCSAPARVEFDRAVALLHHMTYPGARAAFEETAKIDPRCAMAHWGVAMTLFQPLWPTRPGPEELRRGWEAVQTARSLHPPTQRERLFVEAAAAFFQEPESPDYWQRIRRWATATENVYAAFPRDPEAAAFYALALLAAAPSDSVSPANSARAASLLLGVYQRNPEHPGAMHYLVHADDAPGRERESLAIVRKYETVAPRNPHALHMPTHIYTRLGDWDAVIRGNARAAEAALRYPVGERGRLVWDEFPHAIEYLVYAYLQEGADDRAAAQVERLQATPRLQPTFKTAFHLASTRARYALERHAWSEAMSLPPRQPPALDWDHFMWPEAVTWFARGLGAAHEGRLEEARAAAGRLDALTKAASGAGEPLFARNIRILRLGVGAWIAHAEHETAFSVALMREAAELELATPKHAVTPGPTLPAYELLGDLLMEQAHPAAALAAYERALELYPRRFNSLLGAARAARASGDESQARAFYQTLLEVAGGSTRAAVLEEARAFVSRRR